MIVVVDGLRSWQEYTHLKQVLRQVKIYLVAIYADKNLRWDRSITRSHRKKLYGEERDLDELIGINMAPTLAYADFLIKNNFSLADYHDKLEEVYRTIYYT